MPVTFLLLYRLFRTCRTRDAVWLGVVVGLQACTSVYYGVIGIVGLATAGVALVAAGRRADLRRTLPRLAMAALRARLVAAPALLPSSRGPRVHWLSAPFFPSPH